ncbi:MAG: hypothetical protein HKN23_00150 [Verrucomicrobiales bacterium]|nr:hypothetical protein [Verrucomicrobiales bacterium]
MIEWPEKADPKLEKSFSRWDKASRWSIGIIVFLAVYLFLYPALLLWLDDPDNFDLEEKIPEGAYEAVEITFLPHIYCYDHFQFYEAYLDWLDEKVR